MEYIIRKRKVEDIEAIQKVITLGWQQTYRGIVNDNFLDNLSLNEEDRIKRSKEKFDEKNNNVLVLEVNNKVVGFVYYDKSDDIDYGEICALYILKEYKGYGYGRKLFESATKELKKMGFDKIIVGCLEGNKSNEFYKHIGCKLKGSRIFSKAGEDYKENVYYYEMLK